MPALRGYSGGFIVDQGLMLCLDRGHGTGSKQSPSPSDHTTAFARLCRARVALGLLEHERRLAWDMCAVLHANW